MGAELLYLNGTLLPLSEGRISVEDRGFQLGDGVYEVIKIMNGRALWLEEHLERLEVSLAAIKLAGGASGHDLKTVIPELAERSGVVTGAAYIQVTRGACPRDFLMPQVVQPTVLAYVQSIDDLSDDAILRGAVLHAVVDQRWGRCDIKAIDLLAAVMAREEARAAGADEALFVSPDGTVREGGASNIFAFIGGTLRTHPADNHILSGVTRLRVLALAREAGYRVEEEAFTLSDLAAGGPGAGPCAGGSGVGAADFAGSGPGVAGPGPGAAGGCEVFLTSTLKDVMPVVRVGDQVVGDGRPGRLTLALADRFRQEQASRAGLEPPRALGSPVSSEAAAG